MVIGICIFRNIICCSSCSLLWRFCCAYSFELILLYCLHTCINYIELNLLLCHLVKYSWEIFLVNDKIKLENKTVEINWKENINSRRNSGLFYYFLFVLYFYYFFSAFIPNLKLFLHCSPTLGRSLLGIFSRCYLSLASNLYLYLGSSHEYYQHNNSTDNFHHWQF